MQKTRRLSENAKSLRYVHVFAYTFPAYEYLRTLLNAWVPGVVQICLWGLLSGTAAILVYRRFSNQTEIERLKARTREIRNRMLSIDSDQAEAVALATKNLKVSLRFLGKVTLPSLVASIPVLVVVVWMSAFETYSVPPRGESVRVELLSNGPATAFMPQGAFVHDSDALHYVVSGGNGEITVMEGGRLVYSGNPERPPVHQVTKKKWLHTILGNVGGYIRTDASLEAVVFHFPRRQFIAGVPSWLSTWEFPFFVTMMITALWLKFRLKIS